MLSLKKDVKKEIPDLSTMTLLATVERYINRIPAARDWRLTEWITLEVGRRDRHTHGRATYYDHDNAAADFWTDASTR
jgi:hypothetical protein